MNASPQDLQVLANMISLTGPIMADPNISAESPAKKAAEKLATKSLELMYDIVIESSARNSGIQLVK